MHQQQYFCICGYRDRQIELPSGPFAGKKPKIWLPDGTEVILRIRQYVPILDNYAGMAFSRLVFR